MMSRPGSIHLLAISALAIGSACGHHVSVGSETNANENRSVCGNGTAEGEDGEAGYEACDGTDLRDATCSSIGLPDGTLVCTSTCAYDTSGWAPRR
jgi:hypothetical protein